MGVCIGWQRFQRGATNETEAKAQRRLTWRTRQINSSELRTPRDNSNLLLSAEVHFGAIVPCSHLLPPKGTRRAAIGRELFFSSPGAHSSRSPSFSSLARTHSAIWTGTYTSQHLATYRQMGKPALPSACFSGRGLMEAYPRPTRLRKDRNNRQAQLMYMWGASFGDSLSAIVSFQLFFCRRSLQL